MYAQNSILCQFGPRNLSSVQQLISQPILVQFWWELYHFCIFYFFLDDTFQKTASTLSSGSRDSHFVGMCPCCLCKPGRQIQIIEPTILELVFKLVKHSQNMRMQWWVAFLGPFLQCWLIVKIKCPCKTRICQCIVLESIPFCFVGDS